MELQHSDNRFFATDPSGDLIAEITFPFTSPNTVDINHTFVGPSLRGQGVGDVLMGAAVSKIREAGWKTAASCPFASKWFTKHPEHADLLA